MRRNHCLQVRTSDPAGPDPGSQHQSPGNGTKRDLGPLSTCASPPLFSSSTSPCLSHFLQTCTGASALASLPWSAFPCPQCLCLGLGARTPPLRGPFWLPFSSGIPASHLSPPTLTCFLPHPIHCLSLVRVLSPVSVGAVQGWGLSAIPTAVSRSDAQRSPVTPHWVSG